MWFKNNKFNLPSIVDMNIENSICAINDGESAVIKIIFLQLRFLGKEEQNQIHEKSV